MSLPGSLQELVEQLKQLPGVGAKSAQRLAFHILRTPREDTDRLCQAIRDVKDRVTYCSICNNITDADPCQMCGDEGRDHRIICVVEEPQNVSVVDRTGGFRGSYHVLMGTISPVVISLQIDCGAVAALAISITTCRASNGSGAKTLQTIAPAGMKTAPRTIDA